MQCGSALIPASSHDHNTTLRMKFTLNFSCWHRNSSPLNASAIACLPMESVAADIARGCFPAPCLSLNRARQKRPTTRLQNPRGIDSPSTSVAVTGPMEVNLKDVEAGQDGLMPWRRLETPLNSQVSTLRTPAFFLSILLPNLSAAPHHTGSP
ncbi:hypothetical protein RUM43_008701 [Polyplax serrata]|uniref:Uncharacterized protein n=1 Tax=Polyplax serrata TaxID=468196 RepID=A0AAN8P696_POLSC